MCLNIDPSWILRVHIFPPNKVHTKMKYLIQPWKRSQRDNYQNTDPRLILVSYRTFPQRSSGKLLKFHQRLTIFRCRTLHCTGSCLILARCRTVPQNKVRTKMICPIQLWRKSPRDKYRSTDCQWSHQSHIYRLCSFGRLRNFRQRLTISRLNRLQSTDLLVIHPFRTFPTRTVPYID